MKINSKWIIELNVTSTTTKLPEDNMGKKYSWLWFNRRYLRYNINRMINERKNDKLDTIKIKNFISTKDTFKRIKRKTTDCE